MEFDISSRFGWAVGMRYRVPASSHEIDSAGTPGTYHTIPRHPIPPAACRRRYDNIRIRLSCAFLLSTRPPPPAPAGGEGRDVAGRDLPVKAELVVTDADELSLFYCNGTADGTQSTHIFENTAAGTVHVISGNFTADYVVSTSNGTFSFESQPTFTAALLPPATATPTATGSCLVIGEGIYTFTDLFLDMDQTAGAPANPNASRWRVWVESDGLHILNNAGTEYIFPGGIDPAGHTHSKLVASDGAPDPAWSVDATGNLAAAGAYSLDLNAGELILSADGDDSITVDTDDQMDFKINNADEAHLTASGLSAQNFAFRVKNTSAAVATANDAGYINEDGEYKTTTTAYGDVAWCVVVKGGANNADIYVARRGRMTVALNGNCSAGDYLYTSTTAGQAQPQAYTRPELFAVALTANAGGAGGTCSALLLCNRDFVPKTDADYLLRVNSASDSGWNGSCNGAPAGAVVTYNDLGGNENSMVPAATTQLGKIVLRNTTRSEDAYISSVNTGANQITVTNAAHVAAWQNADVITVVSTTVSGGGIDWLDIDFSEDGTVPTLAVAVSINFAASDGGAHFSAYVLLHPYDTYAASRYQLTYNEEGGYQISLPLFQRRIATQWNASGAGTLDAICRLEGWWEARP